MIEDYNQTELIFNDVTGTIQEALRDYLGDGDGVDVLVLDKHDRQVAAIALEAAAKTLEKYVGQVSLPASTIISSLNRRAERLRAGETVS